MAKAGDSYGGFYTVEEIRDVIAYAAARHVDVVPEIDLPGHTSAILAAFPALSCSGEAISVKNTFGVHERILCAGNKKVYEFLYALLDEVCALFPSPFIHLGGDESPKTAWKSCPKCNTAMKENGIAGYEHLQSYFTKRLAAYVTDKGKRPIAWNEACISGDLDEGVAIHYWMEMAPGASYVVPEIAKGRKFIFSNMNQFYCDYSYADIPMKATYLYEPVIKGTGVPDGNVLGIESPMWTEWTPEAADIERCLYPRLLSVAECGWTKDKEYGDFITRVKEYLSFGVLNKLTPTPWEQATVSGEAALTEIVNNMLQMSKRYGAMAEDMDGKAEAVLPEGAEPIDRAAMMRGFMEDKMKAAYTHEEIEQVINMLSAAMRQG
jgi:hexosaminidase